MCSKSTRYAHGGKWSNQFAFYNRTFVLLENQVSYFGNKTFEACQGFSDFVENKSVNVSAIWLDQGSEYLRKRFQSLCI